MSAVEHQPRVVFDCMIFLQAILRSAGPAAACLGLVEEGRVRLYLSRDVLTEVRGVLGRRRLRSRFRQLTPQRIAAFLRRLGELADVLDDVPRLVTHPRDPKDEPYLNLALAAGADYLVTRDRDLLDLMSTESEEGRAFRTRFPDLIILDPVEFLRRLNG